MAMAAATSITTPPAASCSRTRWRGWTTLRGTSRSDSLHVCLMGMPAAMTALARGPARPTQRSRHLSMGLSQSCSYLNGHSMTETILELSGALDDHLGDGGEDALGVLGHAVDLERHAVALGVD